MLDVYDMTHTMRIMIKLKDTMANSIDNEWSEMEYNFIRLVCVFRIQ